MDAEGSRKFTRLAVRREREGPDDQIATVAFALSYAIFHYDLVLVNALIRLPDEHPDANPSELSISIITSTGLTAHALQVIMNRNSGTFAGQYALEAYLVAARRAIKLLQFLPWMTGRHEARGGLGGIEGIMILFEVAWLWQAATLPRVEQHSIEDDE